MLTALSEALNFKLDVPLTHIFDSVGILVIYEFVASAKRPWHYNRLLKVFPVLRVSS